MSKDLQLVEMQAAFCYGFPSTVFAVQVDRLFCGIHFIRASKLREQIAALTEDIEELKFAKTQILSRLGCVDSEIGTRKLKNWVFP